MAPIVRLLLGGQAAYYILTGVWPLLHMASFEAVTGPKVDDWLVRMVGLLAATIGVTLALAVRESRWSAEVRALAILSALSFAAIDVRYALSGRISPIYLADAAVELLLVAFLAGATVSARRSAP
jgi:energy-converting hydrogenase Eha subunit E